MSSLTHGDLVEFVGQPGYVWQVIQLSPSKITDDDSVVVKFIVAEPGLPTDPALTGFEPGSVDIASICSLRKLTPLEALGLQAEE